MDTDVPLSRWTYRFSPTDYRITTEGRHATEDEARREVCKQLGLAALPTSAEFRKEAA